MSNKNVPLGVENDDANTANGQYEKRLYLTKLLPQLKAEATAVSEGRYACAYIIEGAEGIGKRTFADVLACLHFCTSKEVPCFECSACRRVLKHVHPDVHYTVPDWNMLKVEAVRDILATVHETPYEGGKKLYIIDKFHTANDFAQNALLKTLEDPPESVIFILLCENAMRLLPTVRSRCRTIRLNGFERENIEAQLRLIFGENERIEGAAADCGRNIGKAISAINDEAFQKLEESAKTLIRGNISQPEAAALLEKLEKQDLARVLDILEDRLFDEISAKGVDKSMLLGKIKAVGDAKMQKQNNVNGGLIIEELAYALVKGGNKWQR